MNIIYNGISFSGNTEVTNLQYSWGVHDSVMTYMIQTSVDVCESDCGYFVDIYCPLQLCVTFGALQISSGYDESVSKGGFTYRVTCTDSNIRTSHFGPTVFVGFPDSALTTEKEYSITLKWTSNFNTDITASETVKIKTPVYWTRTTVSNLKGISNRGNITYNWDLTTGVNNSIKGYAITIQAHNPVSGECENLRADYSQLNATDCSYIFEEGAKEYVYQAYVSIVPEYGEETKLYYPAMIDGWWDVDKLLKWLPKYNTKIKQSEKWVDCGMFVKTATGWKECEQVFTKTATGWK